MGKALLRAAPGFAQLTITGAIVRPDSPHLGKDAGEHAGLPRSGLQLTADIAAALAQADVAIDFSRPEASLVNVQACRQARKPLLFGTTGYDQEIRGVLSVAASEIPVLIAPNTSLGVTVLTELVRMAARALPADFDIEIIEAHHRKKLDAPSGTAKALRTAACEGRGQPPPAAERIFRHGERPQEEIWISVVRAGDIVGEHTVLLAGEGEQVQLMHRATDRAVFAKGALRAALWLAWQHAGSYSMRDLLPPNQ